MDLSTFVAQVVAVSYLAIGVGMLADKAHYKKFLEEMYKDSLGLYIGGFIALIAGFSLVSFHNFWVKDWTVLVTLIGWAALIKGVLILGMPTHFSKWSKHMFKPKNMHVYSLIVLGLGLVFAYFGFLA